MDRSGDRLACDTPPAALQSGASEWAPARSLVARVVDGVARRAQRWTAGNRSRGDAVERAWLWLSSALESELIPITGAAGDACCPSLLCSAASLAADLGETQLALAWFERAAPCQRGDGAINEGASPVASLFGTAQFIRAGLQIEAARTQHDASGAQTRLARAGFFLSTRIDAEGCVVPEAESSGLVDRWALPLARLSCLTPLAAAARRWGLLHWSREVERAAGRALREVELAPWTTPTLLWAHSVTALVELGRDATAREIARYLDCAQRSDGAVATHIGARRYSTWAAALAARAWYAVGDRERGDRTMTWLASRQTDEGYFAGAEGHNVERPARSTPGNAAPAALWTVVNYLAAAQAQVHAAFDDAASLLPRSIDRRDGRYREVRRWLDDLGPAPRVLDAGCGVGRYLVRLGEELPLARLVGVDGSRALLAELPNEIETRQGDLLRLPLADGECDAAFAVESLEHALLPRRAIDELCRVVRPGGRVLVIDKCRSRQALSRHEPWERWFDPAEVSGWLSAHCDDVEVRSIAHGAHLEPSGLFLCWTGRRKADAVEAVRRAA